MENKAQIVYFSHGGGPLPILGDRSHQAMVDFMVQLPTELKRPDVILVISAHWEEQEVTIMGADHPRMFHDYYGFPPEAYEIDYPASGNPELADRIMKLLNTNQLPARIDRERGFDHGLFIPLKLMYPEADIPSIQLSLIRGLDSAVHLALGKALRGLLEENILVIGSGFSFHNMQAFGSMVLGMGMPDPANDRFQDWLIETCTGPTPQGESENCLVHWEKAPSARYCHPREEHLLPLLVCAGMAGKPGRKVFDDLILGKRSVAFLWQ